MSVKFLPVLPVWAIAAVAAGLLILLIAGSALLRKKRVPARWIAALGALRVLIVAVFVVCLLQPVVSYEKLGRPSQNLMVLVDDSRSMNTGGPDGKSKLAEITPELQPALDQLRQNFDVQCYAFSDSARTLDSAKIAQLQCAGDTTDYANSLEAAWSVARQKELEKTGILPEAGRVLLISDGNDRGKRSTAESAKRYGLAVDVVVPQAGPQDQQTADSGVQIVGVHSPRQVLLGTELRFAVHLKKSGTNARNFEIKVTEDGELAKAYPVQMDADLLEKQVSLVFRPEKKGPHKYSFSISGAANARPIRQNVEVIDRRYEVLLLQDTWRWDFKYLLRNFEDDPHFNFTAFAARGKNSYVQFAEPDREVDLGSFPQSYQELAAFDIIVLGDVDPTRWPEGMASMIRQLVVEEGKSLIVIAGTNLAQYLRFPDLEFLLPVTATPESAKPTDKAVKLRITPEALTSAFFYRPQGDQALWQKLPPVDHIYPPLRKKPGAVVLVEAAQMTNNFGAVPVMTEQTVGRGRVFYIATDTLWKWQTLGPQTSSQATAYKIFWQQALRAMVPGNGDAALDVLIDAPRYEAGQNIALHAWLHQAAGDADLECSVKTPDNKAIPLQFEKNLSQPTMRTCSFEAPVPGLYTVETKAKSKDKTLGEVKTVLNIAPAGSEDDDVGVNESNLLHLARETGGQKVDLADPATFPQPAANIAPVKQSRTVPLWDNFTLLGVLALLLAVDWLTRLGRGYF